MSLMTVMVVFLMALEIVRLGADLFWYLSSHLLPNALAAASPILDPDHRDLFFAHAPWFLFISAIFLTSAGAVVALKGPRVVRVIVPEPDLPEALRGFRIVQISDLHVSENVRREYVQRVVQSVVELKPDMIAITGDLVDGDIESIAAEAEPLRHLKAKYGVFYVTGNHEYYWGFEPWLKRFHEFGFKILLNAHHIITVGQNKLCVAGIPDITARRFGVGEVPDAKKAVATAGQRDYTIFLTHQPNTYSEAEKIDCNLQLSGHTHSGQFFPANFLIPWFHTYYRGLNRHANKFWIYVSPGTGFWGPPNRLGVRAEITCLELTQS